MGVVGRGGGTGVGNHPRGGLAGLLGGLAGSLGSFGGLLRRFHVLAGLLGQLLRGQTLVGGAHDASPVR